MSNRNARNLKETKGKGNFSGFKSPLPEFDAGYQAKSMNSTSKANFQGGRFTNVFKTKSRKKLDKVQDDSFEDSFISVEYDQFKGELIEQFDVGEGKIDSYFAFPFEY